MPCEERTDMDKALAALEALKRHADAVIASMKHNLDTLDQCADRLERLADACKPKGPAND